MADSQQSKPGTQSSAGKDKPGAPAAKTNADKVVTYDSKTETFSFTMTKEEGNIVSDMQKITKEAGDTCKGNVSETTIQTCKGHYKDKAIDKIAEKVGLGGDGPVGVTGDYKGSSPTTNEFGEVGQSKPEVMGGITIKLK